MLLIVRQKDRDELRRRKFSQANRKVRDRRENAMRRGLRKVWASIEKTVNRRVERIGRRSLSIEEIFRPSEFRDQFNSIFIPHVTRTIFTGIQFEKENIESQGLVSQYAGVVELAGLPTEIQTEPTDIELPPGFDVDLTPTMRRRIAETLSKREVGVWNKVGKTTRKRLERTILKAQQEGVPFDVMAGRIRKTLKGVKRVQPMAIARTETTHAASTGGHYEREELQIEFKEWISTLDANNRGANPKSPFDHLAPDGQTVRNNEVFIVSGQSLLYPADSSQGASAGNIVNCFLPKTWVAGQFSHAMKSHYEGMAVELITDGGKTLRTTLNHPILTMGDEFVPAKDIRAGQKVFCSEQENTESIEQIFQSLKKNKSHQRTIQNTNYDFHGDGRNVQGKIEIIRQYEPMWYGIPSKRKTERVVSVEQFYYFGYVYDVQSTSGIVVANGILASNCRCVAGAAPAPAGRVRRRPERTRRPRTESEPIRLPNRQPLNPPATIGDDVSVPWQGLRQDSLDWWRANWDDVPLEKRKLLIDHNPDTEWVLIDGRHRLITAAERGERTIVAKMRIRDAEGNVIWEGERSLAIGDLKPSQEIIDEFGLRLPRATGEITAPKPVNPVPQPSRRPGPQQVELPDRSDVSSPTTRRALEAMDLEQRSQKTWNNIQFYRTRAKVVEADLEARRRLLVKEGEKLEKLQAKRSATINKIMSAEERKALPDITAAERKRINANVKRQKKRVDELNEQIEAQKSEHDALLVRHFGVEKKGKINVTKDSNVSRSLGQRADEARADLDNLVGEKHNIDIRVIQDEVRPQYVATDKAIRLNSSSRRPVAGHEIGHGLEHQSADGLRLSKGFLHSRGGFERVRKLAQPELDEVGILDEFNKALPDDLAEYVGKYYNGFTEVISVGVEQLMHNPVAFARNDPEYFRFVMGFLRGDLL